MQTVAVTTSAQKAITRDHLTLRVDAVVYYRVIDPVKAVIDEPTEGPWGYPGGAGGS